MEVIFSNGARFQVTWPQFRFLRDNYELVKKYRLEQVDTETFQIHADKFRLVGSQVLMCILDEIESGIYDYDYREKVVLDVGGFEGESAAFFWAMGAKKVIIYEPVIEHKKFIEENVRLNKINASIHSEGVGNENGELAVEFNKTDNCFGLQAVGLTNKRVIKIRSITQVIADSRADVAKIDCEGAELSLVNVPKAILRSLEYVIVETHSPEIRRTLIKKFRESGFVLAERKEETSGEISIAYFKRIGS